MNDANAIASALATVFNESERRYLADDPAEAVESLSDLKVELCDPEQLGEQSCGVAGLYLRQSKRILAARAMSHRRTKFTVLHEYGHHLAQHTLSSARVIAQTTPRWRQALFGERIADAFAAEILIPSSDVDEVLGGRQPTARDLAELFLRSNGSREACCVRISQRLNGSGYVILARGSKVLYCKPVGSAYSVRFGQDEGPRH
jgi:Zn-dependent peptidase ImmA (M78 family)